MQTSSLTYTQRITYIELKRYREAEEVLEGAIRIQPSHAMAHFWLGLAYFDRGDKDSAVEEYKALYLLNEKLANELLELINK